MADRTADSVGDEVEPTAPCDRPEPRPSGAPGGLGPCRLALAVTLLVAALPGDVLAWPGIRTPSLAEHVAGLFHRPEQVGMSKGDAPFARLRKPQGLLEADRPFASKKVEIDSTGVHYTPHTAGFPSGTPVSLALEDYLDIGLQHTYQTSWYTSLRRIRKAGAAQVRRRGTSRLEWKVPFPAPKPIRRFIGDEGSLRINGQHTATVSGKSQWTSGEVRTLAGRPSRFPALSLDQESKFLVEGSVGEAINVRIDQNTAGVGTGFGGFRDQLANQIKLDYKGDDDAVFQEIQAGNTTLALPGTRFVGYQQQSTGLFGIRAKGHLGPMAFTTIASHEKSESNRQSFRGGAQVDTLTISDYAYLRNTYFFLDLVYSDRLDDFRKVASG